jgi:hypothetical protein
MKQYCWVTIAHKLNVQHISQLQHNKHCNSVSFFPYNNKQLLPPSLSPHLSISPAACAKTLAREAVYPGKTYFPDSVFFSLVTSLRCVLEIGWWVLVVGGSVSAVEDALSFVCSTCVYLKFYLRGPLNSLRHLGKRRKFGRNRNNTLMHHMNEIVRLPLMSKYY